MKGKLRKQFDLMDQDGDGVLDFDEVVSIYINSQSLMNYA